MPADQRYVAWGAKKIVGAVKRGKPSPLTEDVAICHLMGWTHRQLQEQPARFVERLALYLETLGSERSREKRRWEEELRRLKDRR